MRNLTLFCLLCLAFVLAACGSINVNIVPTTGDSSLDAAAAQNAMPNLSNYGYTSSDARNITDAIAAVGGTASLFTGNPAAAAAIAKIDDMIRCYQNVGAVAARVYTFTNIGELLQGQVPKVGALAIVNRDRITRNLPSCALNTGSGFSAQSATIEPCAGSGTLTRSGETLDYVYAATDPQLCTLFAAALQQ
jgi:hypothetical protein